MTAREFYATIIEANVNEDVTAFAADALEKMNQSNERNRVRTAEKAAAKAIERAPMIDAIMGVLCDTPKTAATILEETGLEIKPQMVSRLLMAAVEAGDVTKTKNKDGHVVYAR